MEENRLLAPGCGWAGGKRSSGFRVPTSHFLPRVLQTWQALGFAGLPSAPMSPWQHPARHRGFLEALHPTFAFISSSTTTSSPPAALSQRWHGTPTDSGCFGSTEQHSHRVVAWAFGQSWGWSWHRTLRGQLSPIKSMGSTGGSVLFPPA